MLLKEISKFCIKQSYFIFFEMKEMAEDVGERLLCEWRWASIAFGVNSFFKFEKYFNAE